MAYSFNRKREGLIFASTSNVNASFKDLSAVCDVIRYKNAASAIALLDTVSKGSTPILYKKYNKYMGSRHELGGQKGRYPKKCAVLVRKVLVNAMANAENKGEDPQEMYIVHASANKTLILQRTAPKGLLRLGHSMGRGSTRWTNLELARIELALGYGEEEGLSERMKKRVGFQKRQHDNTAKAKPQQKGQRRQQTAKPQAAAQKAATVEIKA